MSYPAGKSVLITGASSGIGAALARELAREGARVGLLARRADRLESLAAEIEAAGGTAAWAVADVQDSEQLAAALEATASALDGADVVIANAGYNRPEPPSRFKAGRALRIYDVNLLGAIRLIDWALPYFLEQGSGHIVGIASVASYLGLPFNDAYCGSKAAMRIHLQSLRVSLKRHRIAVTTICPGFVKSELTEKMSFPMPFIWETDRAARRIVGAIAKRRGEVIFPWQMRLLISLANHLPRPLVERLLSRG